MRVGEGSTKFLVGTAVGATTGFAVGYQPGAPICPALEGRAEVTPGVLRKVVIVPEGHPRSDPDRELRKDLATQ